MKMRLLTALFATAALGGCATYDYGGGSAPGGYYYGRPSVEYYGPYDNGYGYGGYGGSLGYYSGYYGYGYSPYRFGYYGGYYPYYPYRPHHPRPPRPDDGDNRPPPSGDRPPPWRRPGGGYQDSGQVMIPPHNRTPPAAPGQPQVQRQDGGRGSVMRERPQRFQGGDQPRPRMVSPAQPRMEQSRPMPRVERASPPPQRSGNPGRERRQED